MADEMRNRPGDMPKGPISTMPPFDRLTKGQSFGPRVELVVGRDGYSGGISLVAYWVDEDDRAAARPLFCHRWQSPPQSIDECLKVAYRGLLAYIEEASIALP